MRITLNINPTEIRLLAMEGKQVRKWGVAPLAEHQIRDGRILEPQAVAKTVDSLFKSVQVPKNRIWLTVGGLSHVDRVLELPRMKISMLEEAILRAARKEISLPLDELYLAWQIIDAGKREVRVFIVGIPRTLIDDLFKTMELAGIKIAGMDLKSLALARAANHANAVVVDFEPDGVEIVVVTQGMPSILHTAVPRGEGATPEDSVRHLLDELSRTIGFYNITHPDRTLPRAIPLLVTGSLSTGEETMQLLRANNEYLVEIPAPVIKYPPDCPIALFAANIGLGLKGPSRRIVQLSDPDRFHDINLNILAARKARQTVREQARSQLMPSAFLVAILLLLPLYYVRNHAVANTSQLQERFDRVNRELRLARLSLDEAVNTENTIAQLLKEVATLKDERRQLMGSSIETSMDLSAAFNALSSFGTLTAIEANPREITIHGESAERDKVIGYAHALEKLGVYSGVRIATIDRNNSGDGVGILFSIVLSR